MNAHPHSDGGTRRGQEDMANEDTPFIRNCWYVACFSTDIEEGTLFSRVLLSEPVVLYRLRDRTVVAMKDRCPHRSFPLSAGRLVDDEIVCGYHGMRYRSDGRCTLVPTQHRAPGAITARTYVTMEQAPLVWIWMGDPVLAAATPPPTEHWMLYGSSWASSRSYLNVSSNYVFLHENLLDLSHLTFLHAGTFGTPDYALAPYETNIGADVIEVKRSVQPTYLPPIYAEPLGLTGVDAARIVTSTYRTPGMSISAVVLRDLTKPEATRVDHHIRTAQLVTPCDRDHVHYHFVVSRDFATEAEEVTAFILQSILAAFAEDVFALESMAKIRRLDPDPNFREFSVVSDRAGVTLRRWLLKGALAEAETARERAPT
jgi:phenylpropionate dioxygenase-like ring-hydroxylating dioxygenase large terminal subunit